MPQPPEGDGPPLEWNYSDRRTLAWVFGATTVLFIVYLTIHNLTNSQNEQPGYWFTDWGGWLIVLVPGLLMVLFGRSDRYSAGADWLMHGKSIVRTYELTSVTLEKDWSQGNLALQDRYGNGFEFTIGWAQHNEALWDLVYNGIRHSVARGATINQMALDQLRLDDVLAMREQAERDHRH